VLFGAAICAAVEPPPEDPPVEQTKKNIRVLRGLPTSQLIPVMAVMANSLGVTCAYCHAEQWESDEKPPKEKARRMLHMTLDTNRAFFDGRTAVTCNTCHRGALQPRPVPRIEDVGWNKKPLAAAAGPEALPSLAAIIERYISSMGGRHRIHRIRARRLEGFVTRDSGRASAGGRFEIAQERPDRVQARADILYPPEANRWLASLFLLDFDNAEMRARMAVVGRDRIDGEDTVVVELRGTDGRLQRLEFNTRRGDLRRISDEFPTPVGPLPEAYKLYDYRRVDGVRMPFAMEWSRGDYHVVHRVTQVEQTLRR
jgi:Photosynthetic reaction centre cytochrome C subunit